ncbi:MAG: hypothetical protein QG637_976 [Chloroflexota bacterium]|nr:hypothetical protein [Chloroflexota bacterium]
MYLTPSICPICGDKLTVTRLNCPSCDTTLEGRYQFGRLEQLSPEQRAFVELFVRCDGKLNWVAQELKLSYPSVRSRLDEAIRALGYEVREAPPAEEKQRLASTRQAILDELAAGKITSEEAVKRLQEA